MARFHSSTPIYLDYQASCPIDERVLTAMAESYRAHPANASNVSHQWGRAAHAAVEAARTQVAELFGCQLNDVIFTSGATEANNLAITGVAWARRTHGRFVANVAEHRAVLDPLRRVRQFGHECQLLSVNDEGMVSVDELRTACQAGAVFVSTLAVNNEIGSVQELATLAEVCHESGIPLHCDAAQVGQIEDIPHTLAPADMISVSAHKLYGPQGVGALIIRRDSPYRPRLLPLIDGGGQEQRLRSGTLPVALIVGFGHACQLLQKEHAAELRRIRHLRDQCWSTLQTAIPDILLNGPRVKSDQRSAANLNVSIPGIDGSRLLSALPGIAASSGSACSTTDPTPSHVLKAIGRNDTLARASLRLSFGRWTTAADVEAACRQIATAISELRK